MKPRIDHSNYEAWLLDQLEGRLTPEEEGELNAFLLAHPQLQAECDLPTVQGDAERMAMFDREGLKRTLPPQGVINEHSLDDYLIARLEGELGPAQLTALQDYLVHHPQHARRERLIGASRISPDASIHPAKEFLKRALPPVGSVGPETLSDHLVARLEGDLDADQERSLAAYLLSHEEARSEWALMQRARIAAEEVLYPLKDDLKREAKVIPLFAMRATRWAAAAAVLAVVVMAWWFRSPEKPQVAQVPKEVVLPSAATQEPERATESPQAPTESLMVEEERPTILRDSTPALAPSPAVSPKARELPHEPSSHQQQVAQHEDRRNRDELPDSPQPEPLAVAHTAEPVASSARAAASVSPVTADARSLGEALAGVLRERVLERPADERRALDATDAVAAVDRGLKVVGGETAGLSVRRDDQGKQRGFSLRLGRNLAFTASR